MFCRLYTLKPLSLSPQSYFPLNLSINCQLTHSLFSPSLSCSYTRQQNQNTSPLEFQVLHNSRSLWGRSLVSRSKKNERKEQNTKSKKEKHFAIGGNTKRKLRSLLAGLPGTYCAFFVHRRRIPSPFRGRRSSGDAGRAQMPSA